MRIRGIQKLGDYPTAPGEGPSAEMVELFEYLFPGVPDAEIDQHHAGTAITAHNPTLALLFAQLSKFMAVEMEWAKRTDLRELAFATLHEKFKAAYPFESRYNAAIAAGLSAEQLAMLSMWRTSRVFDDEQRLVIEYTQAVVAADVPDELFKRVVDRYGEKGAVEFTALVGFWSCWAMILNAIRP